MTSTRIASIFQRRALSNFSKSHKRWIPPVTNRFGWSEGVAVSAGIVLVLSAWTRADTYTHGRFLSLSTARCEDDYDDEDEQYASGYTEAERFFYSLEYHRSLLHDYERRWLDNTVDGQTVLVGGSFKERWPRKVPTEAEVAALELDSKFCQKNLEFYSWTGSDRRCNDLLFRIGSHYISRKDDEELQKKGFKIIKELAEKSHPDGMCLYGMILNEGSVAGVDPNPQQAVVWLRRCVDEHRHIKATYELALHMYIGEGVPEDTEFAVRLFRKAAHLGHAGAAYMLGECLLAGVGAEKDRGDALEWLVLAAELGHNLARSRVVTLLHEDYDLLDAWQASTDRRIEEAENWMCSSELEKGRAVTLERRYSIGGGSQNPAILARRKSIIEESRGGATVHRTAVDQRQDVQQDSTFQQDSAEPFRDASGKLEVPSTEEELDKDKNQDR